MNEKNEIPFQQWWQEFKRDSNNNKGSVWDDLCRISLYISQLSGSKKRTFLDEVMNLAIREDYLAMEVIKKFNNPEYRKKIAEIALKLLDNENLFESNDSVLNIFISILLQEKTNIFDELIENYYTKHKFNKYFNITNELYGKNERLFLSAYERFLKNYSTKEFIDSCLLDGLLQDLSALKFLRDNLPGNLRKILYKFLTDRADKSWNADKRDELIRLVKK